MEAKVYKEEDKEEDPQEFPEDEAGQENPSAGSGQLDQILESIRAMTYSVGLLQVKADREQQLPQQGAQKAATLRRAPAQARQAGATGTPRTRVTFPTAPTLAFPTAPS